jgi:hypothetical protein
MNLRGVHGLRGRLGSQHHKLALATLRDHGVIRVVEQVLRIAAAQRHRYVFAFWLIKWTRVKQADDLCSGSTLRSRKNVRAAANERQFAAHVSDDHSALLLRSYHPGNFSPSACICLFKSAGTTMITGAAAGVSGRTEGMPLVFTGAAAGCASTGLGDRRSVASLAAVAAFSIICFRSRTVAHRPSS